METTVGLLPMVNGGPDVLTVCSAVISWPGLILTITAAGTVVTCRTTAANAWDSLAAGRAGVVVGVQVTAG